MANLKTPQFSGTVKNGKLRLHDLSFFNDTVASYEGADVVVMIKKAKKIRSVCQNRWYWGICLNLASEFTGHTPEDLHALFKSKFLPKKHLDFFDADIENDTTTTLSTSEFMEYADKIRDLMASFGCYIPNPNEPIDGLAYEQ